MTTASPTPTPVRRWWLLPAFAAAAVGGLLTALLLARPAAPPALERATLLHTARPLPALALTDHSGAAFGREQLAGRWSLLFFGFTNCPDICPTTLATLALALRDLQSLPATARPQVVLVTVDPARDTAPVLARYLGHFDPGFVGLTGEPAALAVLTGALGAVAQAQPADAAGNYTVDHTSAVFLIGPDAALHAVFGSPHEPGMIAGDYRRIVAVRR